MNGNNLCEKIQVAILSDEELSAEYKEHIENCRECKELLSQVTEMKNGLSALSVPGLEEGQITKSVIERIKREKTSIPFPKFRITHHIGTAAAIAIILVAALMIKNPSDLVTDESADSNNGMIVYTSEGNNHVLSGANDTKAFSDDEVIPESEAEIETAEAESETVEDAPIMLKMAPRPAKEENHSEITEDGAVIEEEQLNATNFDFYSTEESVLLADEDVSDTETQNESALEYKDDVSDLRALASSGGGGGSGGGSSSNAAQETYGNLIFEGIEFKSGSEEFDNNIALANNRLYELYGGEYVISKEKLILLGLDNEMFIKLATSITDELFDFYKAAFDIYE